MSETAKNHGRRCAFCGHQGSLTREHVVPAWLSERSLDPLISNVRTPGGEIAITGQPTIKDVCVDCNNGPLAELDDYALQLYDKYFYRVVEPGDLITFEYDFELLFLWLFKVAYNTARARNWDFTPSRELLDFIVKRGALSLDLELLLQLIVPTKARLGEHEKIDPIDNRVGLLMRGGLAGLESGFLVSVKSYHFYVLIPGQGSPRAFTQKIFEKARKSTPGAVRLSGKHKVKVYSSFVDFASHAFQSVGFIRNVRLEGPKG